MAVRRPSSQDSPRNHVAGPPAPRAVLAAEIQHRGAGMREIAEHANVTKMTVSRALRTPEKVAPKTLRRIQDAIEELGFIPNRLAGSLSNRTSRFVPVIVPTMANSIFSDFIDEITRLLDDAGFIPLFGCSNFDPVLEERLLKRYLGWQPSAIVLIGAAQSSGTIRLCRRMEIPVVQAWSLPDRPIDHVVGFSNFQALYRMVRALHGWGYRRIAFGYVDTPGNDRSQQRRLGWETAIRETGGVALPTQAQGGPMTTESGAQIMRDILQRHPDTDVIAFGSDVLAAGALAECRRLALRVPNQLAITGCGDMGLSSIVTPALTTVTIPGRAIGRACAEMIEQLVDGSYRGPTTVELGITLVRRDSA